MKIGLSVILWVVICFPVLSQEKHAHPEHPKGVLTDQLEALAFYNEACELYNYGETERAKQSLYEAINTSFELTEAQLFLGYIFYTHHVLDSALLYLNSGIDFSIDQKPHHYFYVFDTGMRLGEYEIVKHNVGHFKKLYGKISKIEPYEENFPYSIVDFEYYQKSIELVYNYKFWIPKGRVIDTLVVKNVSAIRDIGAQGNLLLVQDENAHVHRNKKPGSVKFKALKLPTENAYNFHFSENGDLVFFCIDHSNNTDIYFSRKEGKAWSAPVQLPESINGSGWDANPYFSESDSTLYFSSNRSGNKDIYVSKLNLTTNTCTDPENLYRINTPKDEMHPTFHDGVFYFSSNGHPGFGGFDLFSTADFHHIGGITFPINFYSLNYPINTHQDEEKIVFYQNKSAYIKRRDYKSNVNFIEVEFIPNVSPFNYDIQMIQMTTENSNGN